MICIISYSLRGRMSSGECADVRKRFTGCVASPSSKFLSFRFLLTQNSKLRTQNCPGGCAIAVLEFEGEADEVVFAFRDTSHVEPFEDDDARPQQREVRAPGGGRVDPLYGEVIYAYQPDAAPEAPLGPVEGQAGVVGMETRHVPQRGG